jgi:hypothetical protein
VRGLIPGTRVSWMTMSHGSCAAQIVLPADGVVPAGVDPGAQGRLVVRIGGGHPRQEEGRASAGRGAHADIESRTTTGTLLLGC